MQKVSKKEWTVVDLLVETGLAFSKSEARRLITQGGVKIKNVRVDNPDHSVKISEPLLIQVGKRHFLKVISS